jgi:hypothetical protein
MLNQTRLVPSGKLEAGEMGQSLVASKFQPFSASNRGGPDQNVLCHRRQRLRQRDVMTMRYCLLSALASLHACLRGRSACFLSLPFTILTNLSINITATPHIHSLARATHTYLFPRPFATARSLSSSSGLTRPSSRR